MFRTNYANQSIMIPCSLAAPRHLPSQRYMTMRNRQMLGDSEPPTTPKLLRMKDNADRQLITQHETAKKNGRRHSDVDI